VTYTSNNHIPSGLSRPTGTAVPAPGSPLAPAGAATSCIVLLLTRLSPGFGLQGSPDKKFCILLVTSAQGVIFRKSGKWCKFCTTFPRWPGVSSGFEERLFVPRYNWKAAQVPFRGNSLLECIFVSGYNSVTHFGAGPVIALILQHSNRESRACMYLIGVSPWYLIGY
jgi:hypothetical protein